MRRVRGRSYLAVVAAVLVAACTPTPQPVPPTTQVAAQTDAPGPAATPEPSAPPGPEPTVDPGATPGPTIGPGEVNRTSLDLRATYDVNALITVGTGAIEMAARIELTNESGDGIDRLELNTVAARLGGITITESSVNGEPVRVRVDDQTLIMPLGGVLPDGATATVLIGYRATLRAGLTGSDWMFTRAGGTLALHRWIPWVSRAVPFNRPNDGEPFVTSTSPRVEVEIVTDQPMVLAGPAADIAELTAGRGQAWAFTVENVRDVSVVLAPDFGVTEGEAKGVPIRVYSKYGAFNRASLLGVAEAAVRADVDQLGVDYPWPVLTVVETEGGDSLETPGLIWIPKNLDSLNRTYAVHHETAHQWFYGLVGNDQRNEPFADEGMADLLARIAMGAIRASRCPTTRLDRPIGAYSAACYYETIQVQGGLVLDQIRGQMGANAFWAAVRAYLEEYRYGIGGTEELLDALREASDVDLRPILRARFPSLY